MKFTEEQVQQHKEMIAKLSEVSEWLKSNKAKDTALNNTTLANLLSPLKYALTQRIKRIQDVSQRLYKEVELLEGEPSHEENAWEAAKDIDTIQSYEAFLSQYEKSRYRSAATRKLNELKKQEV